MEIIIQVNGQPDMTSVVGGELSFYNPETDEYEVRPRTLGDLVAEKLADKIYAAYGHDDRSAMRKQIAEDREKLIRERLEPMLTKVLTEEIYQTNAYGERVGGVVTLKELIVAEGVKALTATSGRYDRKPSLLESTIAAQVNAALTKELNEAVSAAKQEMVKAVRDKAAQFMTDAVLARKAG